MRIVCVSDTHLQHNFKVPDGDLLIHAGDGTGRGSPSEVKRWFEWLASLPHPHKVVIAGNHDWMFQRDPAGAQRLIAPYLERGITYLQDSGCEIGGLKIWGSPWQPWFYDWAFNLRTEQELAHKWDLIPAGTDIVVTHGPPAGILDLCPDGRRVGCNALRQRIETLAPRVHVFGHIHHGYGEQLQLGVQRPTLFCNASTCDEDYRPVNAPRVFDLAV